jgi:hypothetical protein
VIFICEAAITRPSRSFRLNASPGASFVPPRRSTTSATFSPPCTISKRAVSRSPRSSYTLCACPTTEFAQAAAPANEKNAKAAAFAIGRPLPLALICAALLKLALMHDLLTCLIANPAHAGSNSLHLANPPSLNQDPQFPHKTSTLKQFQKAGSSIPLRFAQTHGAPG